MSDPQRDDRPFVLIADDDPDTLNVLVFLAEHKGWRVERATTARGIIERVNCHCADEGRCPDAILSDVNFFDVQEGPRLTGITAIGQIRKRWPNIPVVFYSAFLNTAMRDLIKTLGNTEAVQKTRSPWSGMAESADPVGVIERVEMMLTWGTNTTQQAASYEGPDRRKGQTDPHPRRRVGECEEGTITVPPVLEGVLAEARAVREMHALAGGSGGGGGDLWGANSSKEK